MIEKDISRNHFCFYNSKFYIIFVFRFYKQLFLENILACIMRYYLISRLKKNYICWIKNKNKLYSNIYYENSREFDLESFVIKF